MTAMFDERHELSPTHRCRGLRGNKTALRWVKSAIPDVAKVNLAQKGVRFAHPSKNPNCREPQHDSSEDAPPLHYCKNEHCRQNRENQDEFPVPAEQKIRAIR
jgi:hypothetical protein